MRLSPTFPTQYSTHAHARTNPHTYTHTHTHTPGAVTSLVEDANGVVCGVEYKDKEAGEKIQLSAPLTIVADGCFSNLREGLVDSSSGSVMSKFYAYVVRFAD